MKLRALSTAAALLGFALTVPAAWAQQQPTPEMLKAKKFFETAGIPGGRWIEGETILPYVAPASHFNSTMLYYPGTEKLQADEVRVIFMGSTPYPNQSQSGMSILVQLGNEQNFVFDLGIGSLRNYNSFSIPFITSSSLTYTWTT
jgi:ribonuclease Z